MFNCFVHGWSSPKYMCPTCNHVIYSSSNSTSTTIDNSIVDVSGQLIKNLKNKLKIARKALKDIKDGRHNHPSTKFDAKQALDYIGEEEDSD